MASTNKKPGAALGKTSNNSTPDLSCFEAILLDMNGTFMFGHDRFDNQQKYDLTYQALGGRQLSTQTVHLAISSCMAEVDAKYTSPDWLDRFPAMNEILRDLPETKHLPPPELDLLEATIAHHEMGEISQQTERALRAMSSTHRLGIVSNLWSHKGPWMKMFEQRQITHLFDTIIFSSDGPHIKPSPAIFHLATNQLGLTPEQILFIGDDPTRDIAPAKALGMSTVLVSEQDASDANADWQIACLTGLLS